MPPPLQKRTSTWTMNLNNSYDDRGSLNDYQDGVSAASHSDVNFRQSTGATPPDSAGGMELSNLNDKPAEGLHLPTDAPFEADRRSEMDQPVALHQCARDGDEYNMKISLQKIKNHKKKINQHDDEDFSPLHYAARHNHLNVVKLLLEFGADPNDKGDENTTPLHHAARYKRSTRQRKDAASVDVSPEEHPHDEEGETAANGLPLLQMFDAEASQEGVISCLIKHGAHVNCTDIYGQTPLHFAAMRGSIIGITELLRQPGINIEAQDKQGVTALHMAALHNQVKIAEILINANANLRCRDDEHCTPLHHACSEGNLEIVRMLFEAAARTAEGWVMISNMVSDPDIEGSTCLHVAVDNGHFEVAKLCLEKRANVNQRRKHNMQPLHLAAVSGDMRIVRLLVENNADINALNEEQASPLHKAAMFNHVDVVKFLVERRARINQKDKDGFSPLLLAGSYGHVETASLLLQKGADFTAVDKNEKTVLFLAAEENHPSLVKKLLSYGQLKSLVSDPDRYGNTPLHIAAQQGYVDILKLLLAAGSDYERKNEEEQTALHLAARFGRTSCVREIVQHNKSVVNDEDDNSNSALHLASLFGHDKVVQVLLQLGADVAARNYNKWTPLDLAASKGWLKTCSILLENDAPVDPEDKAKTTPLHLAAKEGHARVVQLLLEWDADISKCDDYGKNCLDLAIENGHPDVAMVIINSEEWESALRNSCLLLDGRIDTPIRKLIRHMPLVAERAFDRCLSYGGERNPEKSNYEITFNYEFLDDMYNCWGDKKRETSDSASTAGSSDVFDEEGRLKEDARPYTSDSNNLKNNHPLMIMVTSEREDLLAHPLVTSLLSLKWSTFGSLIYYLTFCIYLIFLVFLTGYICVTPHPLSYNETTRSDILANDCGQYDISQDLFAKIGKYVIMALAAFNLLKELLQIYQAKLNYLGWTNLIEWIVYVSSFLLVIDFNLCQGSTGFRTEWQWSLGAIAIFLAWLDLLLFIQKFPRFGIYVVMFTDILYTFSQFFVVFFLFIIAFALAFFAVFQSQTSFNSVQDSLIKTSVMMIGEFEFDQIFNGGDLQYDAASYIIFIIFLILMSIIIMNLLVGLAVDDIKAVQEKAELKRKGMQVELALDVERILPDFIRRKLYIKTKTIRPNIMFNNWLKRLWNYSSYQALSSQAIEKALNAELDEMEKVQENQEKLRAELKKTKRIVKDMQEQNARMESMLRVLLRQFPDAKWEEVDFQEEELLDHEVDEI